MKNITLVAVIVGVTLNIAGCSQKSAEEYVASANIALEQKDYQSAIVSLKNAIVLQLDNVVARQKIARAYLAVGDAKSALKELNYTGVLETDFNKTLPMLSLALLLNNENKDVLLVNIEQVTEPEAKAEILLNQGIALLRLNKPEKAKDFFQQISQLVLDNEASELAKVYTLTLSRSPLEETLAFASQVVKHYPHSYQALQLTGALSKAAGESALAVEMFTRLSEELPSYLPARFYLLDAYSRNSQFDEAITLGIKLLKGNAENSFVNEIVGLAYYRKDSLENAKLHIEKAIQNGRDSDQNLLLAGVTNYRLNQSEQAYDFLKAVKPFLPATHPARKMLAALEIQFGYALDADRTLGEIGDFNDQDAALLISNAYSLLQNNQIEPAKKQLESLDSLTIENSTDLLKLGLLKFTFDKEQGIAALAEAVRQDKDNFESKSALGMAYISVGDYDNALQFAKEWQTTDPQSPGGYNLEGLVYANMEQIDKAEQAFKKALDIYPDNLTSLIFFANKFLQEEKYAQANEMVKKLIKVRPDLQDGHVINYRVQSALSQPINAIHDLEKVVDKQATPQNTLLLAQFFYANGQYPQVLKVLSNNVLNKIEARSNNYWQLKMNSYLSLGDIDQADATVNQWLKEENGNPVAWLRKIDLDKISKSPSDVMKTVKLALKALPEDENFKVVELSVLVDLKQFEQADAVLHSLPEQLKNNPLTQLSESRMLAHAGKNPEALEKVLSSYQKAKSNSAAVSIAGLYIELEQVEQAKLFMRQHLVISPNDFKTRHILANQFLFSDFQQAITEYQTILKIIPTDLAALNNLAWLQLQTKQIDYAIESIEKALKLAPRQPNILETAGEIYIAAGRKNDALKVLELGITLSENKSIQSIYEKAKAM